MKQSQSISYKLSQLMVTTNEQMGPFLFDQTKLPYRLNQSFHSARIVEHWSGENVSKLCPKHRSGSILSWLMRNKLIAQRKCHFLFGGLVIFLFLWWALRFSSNFLIRHLLLNLQWLIQSTETFPLSQEIGLNLEREKVFVF